jgi:hypothetical protein
MWVTTSLAILGSTAVVAVGLVFGARRWRSTTKAMLADLEATRVPITGKTYSSDELIGLPAPVQRYFRAVLTNGQPLVSAVDVEHSGMFNTSETGEQWRPFKSTQRVVTQRPGFAWEGRIRMLPGLSVRVHDAYIAEEGILHASLFGLVSLVSLRGTADIAQGELMRFLAEAAWYPTALLPSQGVRWESVDENSARATLKDGANAVTLLFRFAENGPIESVRAEARGRTVAGAVIPTPWEGRWRHYELHDGVLVPTEGEVSWMLPEGPKPYWRGRITKLRYDFSQSP